MQQDHAVSVDARAAPGGAVIVQFDGKSGGELIGRVLSQLRWSSFWSALAGMGLLVAAIAYTEVARDARVTEDEVLRLRATMQAAGMPIPDPEEN